MLFLLTTVLLQSVNTGTIRGTVRPDDAHVRVANEATGFVVETDARHGRFSVQGLEVGGPYVLQARRVGFAPQIRRGLVLALGQPLELDLRLTRLADALDTMRIVVSERTTGVATTFSDSVLHRLPTFDRDLYDFVRLSPYISTKVAIGGGGVSAAGTNMRFNNFLIDGATDRFATGNSSTATQGGKSIPLEAVKEYQVLVAPSDVRYGDFAGALVNSVTRSGTNEVHGSAFVYERNEGLARERDAPYQRTQFGFSLGGPIVRNRLQFFLAPELQHLTAPARGPYLGQAPSISPAMRVRATDVERFAAIMSRYGLDAGAGGLVTTGTPLTNLFGRLDVALPSLRSRAVLLENYARTDNIAFTREHTDTFSLSSYRTRNAFASQLISAQLHTYMPGGAYNAVIFAYRSVWSDNRPDVREPLVLVAVPSTTVGTTILKAGSQEGAQGIHTRSGSLGLTDNITVPIGPSHDLVLGGQVELIRLERGGLNGSYGTWTFSSLDALETGIAAQYQLRRDMGSVGLTHGVQYAAYAGDDWRANNRFSVTGGLRVDAFGLSGHGIYNRGVDSLFQRRTDLMPEPAINISPRVAFAWDVVGTGRDRIRAGAGLFTGRIPAAWVNSAIYSYGFGTATLQCNSAQKRPPQFVPDYRRPPTTCSNGAGMADSGDVDVLDRHLRMAQSARAWLGYDRRLPLEVTATVEALLTRNISDFVFVNLNLVGPQDTDAHGRVMYGEIDPTGAVKPARVSGYSEVIDLRNVSANHGLQLDARLEKRFSRGVAASASYTFTRVRDVQLPLRSGAGAGIVNWSTGRVVSGRHDDLSTGVSLYDLPHRVVLAGTYRAPWHRLTTDLSLYYVGESGSPFTYVAGGVGGRGDLNADGARNDPLYIPTSASDTTQIRFSGLSSVRGTDASCGTVVVQCITAQQIAFERFIADTPCLRHQRGEIMRRNSCREPWSHTSIASLRQSVPFVGAHGLTVQADVFNVFNLLDRRWGQYRVSNPTLLEQVGETAGPPNVAQPVFVFDATKPRWTALVTESAYQFQLGVRYGF